MLRHQRLPRSSGPNSAEYAGRLSSAQAGPALHVHFTNQYEGSNGARTTPSEDSVYVLGEVICPIGFGPFQHIKTHITYKS